MLNFSMCNSKHVDWMTLDIDKIENKCELVLISLNILVLEFSWMEVWSFAFC